MLPESYLKRSYVQARRSISSWYGALGTIVSVVAVLNFFEEIARLPFSFLLQQILATYQAIVHGAFDWILWPFGLKIPSAMKDIIFIYGVVGSSFMRSRMSENIYPDHSNIQPIGQIAKVLLFPERKLGLIVVPGELGLSTDRRLVAAYSVSPEWLRRTFDFVLWPRVAAQYFRNPMVYFAEYSATFQTFPSDYTPGPRKEFKYDRRVVFLFQISAVFLVVLLILIVNGFLVKAT
jgi:hypothetical protein